MPNKKAGVYVRTSSLESEPNQMEQIAHARKFTQAQGFGIVEIYRDHAPGNAKGQRKGLDQCLKDAVNGAFDFIIMVDPSRMFRDMRLVEEYQDFLYRRREIDLILLDELAAMGVERAE